MLSEHRSCVMVRESLACVCHVTHSFISVQIINHITFRKVSYILFLLEIPVCLPILAFIAINSFESFVNPTTCTLLCKADFKCTFEIPSVSIQAFTLFCSQVLAGPSSNSTVADGATSGALLLCTHYIPYKRRAFPSPLSFLLLLPPVNLPRKFCDFVVPFDSNPPRLPPRCC